jgi:hypothetical protein
MSNSDRFIVFQSVIIGDDSWRFLHYPPESVPGQSRDDVPEKSVNKMTQKSAGSQLFGLSMGSTALFDAPKGSTHDSAFLCDTIVPSSARERSSRSQRQSPEFLYIRLDNARGHSPIGVTECLYATKVKQIPYAAHSSDLARDDFFLYGYLKKKATESKIPHWKSLKSSIIHISAESDKRPSQISLRSG